MNNLVFNAFFDGYQKEVAKTLQRQPRRKSHYIINAIILLFAVCSTPFMVFFLSKGYLFAAYVTGCILALLSVLYLWVVWIGQANQKAILVNNLKQYHSGRLRPLVFCIKARGWDNEAMLTWLIQTCETEKNIVPFYVKAVRDIAGVFYKGIFPIISFCCSAFADDLNNSTLIGAAILATMVILMGYAVMLILDWILFRKNTERKAQIARIEEDAKYIRAFLKENNRMPDISALTKGVNDQEASSGKKNPLVCLGVKMYSWL